MPAPGPGPGTRRVVARRAVAAGTRRRGGLQALVAACSASRMRWRRWRILLLILLLAGCARTPADHRAVVRFWAMGSEGRVAQQLVAGFERLHPDIRVKVQQLPWTAAHAKLLTAVAGGTTPDVGQIGNTWIPEMVAMHALSPLDAQIATSRLIRPDDYFRGIWASNVIDGRVYGVPWYVDTRLLFYRRDLLAAAGFAQPPRTWAEWTRMLAAIKAHAAPGDYAILLPLNEFEPLLSLALEEPQPLLRDHDQYGNFRNPGNRQALRFYLQMFREGYAPRIDNTQVPNVPAEFGRGHFVFYISGPWMIQEFEQRMPVAVRDKWMTAPLPGPDGPGSGIAGGASLVLFKHAEHKRAAWKLIEYLSQPAIQEQFHTLTGDLPPRRSSWALPGIANDPYAQAFRAQLERARAVPRVPEWEEIVNEMQVIAARAAFGRMDVAAATAAMDRRTDAILAKRRWMLRRGTVP